MLSDKEINKKLMIMDNYEERWIEKNPQNVYSYLTDNSLLMPLAFANKVNVNHYSDEDGDYVSASIAGESGNLCFADDKDYLRAIALCLIKFEELK